MHGLLTFGAILLGLVGCVRWMAAAVLDKPARQAPPIWDGTHPSDRIAAIFFLAFWVWFLFSVQAGRLLL